MAIRIRKNRAAQYQVYWNNPYTGKRESKSFEDHEKALAFDSLIQHRLRFEKESFRSAKMVTPPPLRMPPISISMKNASLQRIQKSFFRP